MSLSAWGLRRTSTSVSGFLMQGGGTGARLLSPPVLPPMGSTFSGRMLRSHGFGITITENEHCLLRIFTSKSLIRFLYDKPLIRPRHDKLLWKSRFPKDDAFQDLVLARSSSSCPSSSNVTEWASNSSRILLKRAVF